MVAKIGKKMETYEIQMHDQFFGLVGKSGNPYPKNEAHLTLQYIPNTFNGRGFFTKGKKKGEMWGIQSWKTYSQKPNEKVVWKYDKDIEFWLPTYQYFIEMPSRLKEATIVFLCWRITAKW